MFLVLSQDTSEVLMNAQSSQITLLSHFENKGDCKRVIRWRSRCDVCFKSKQYFKNNYSLLMRLKGVMHHTACLCYSEPTGNATVNVFFLEQEKSSESLRWVCG